jgi:Ni,Fe-hydrogenase I large subunit
VNLLAVSHYLDALEFQRDFIRFHAVLGGKNPHLQTFLVGGMSTAMDPDSPQAPINPERLQLLRTLIQMGQQFVRQVYVPDVLAIAGFYPDWFTRGEGVGNFMAYGDYPGKSMHDPAAFFFPAGVVRRRSRFLRRRSPSMWRGPGIRTETTSRRSIRSKARQSPNTRGPRRPTTTCRWIRSIPG